MIAHVTLRRSPPCRQLLKIGVGVAIVSQSGIMRETETTIIRSIAQQHAAIGARGLDTLDAFDRRDGVLFERSDALYTQRQPVRVQRQLLLSDRQCEVLEICVGHAQVELIDLMGGRLRSCLPS